MSVIKQFVSFYCDEKLYGMDIRIISDVSPNSADIMPVPLSDPHIRGLVNIRGQVILVMDIAVILGNPERPITGKSHIVILKTTSALSRVTGLDKDIDIYAFGDKPVGFLIDMIGDVIEVQDTSIEKSTNYIEKENIDYINGVVKLADELLIIVNPLKMLYHGFDKNI
ncbi:MAG: chemotaxis protein CheW [Spirochaetales bacterium]|nr:chemotaxis protein CheW [Spirochaetales bacterium]